MKHRDHNVRQIKASLTRKELALKGTAPSFYNRESDTPPPGPVSPISTKGYDHLDAVVSSVDNSHVTPEELQKFALSSRKIAYALQHVRRTRFDYYRAVLRVESDPGIVKRWEQGSEADSERWLYSWEKACEEAAEFVEHCWPGTRLYVPSRSEEPVDAPKAGSWKRGDVLQKKRWDWEDSARSVGKKIREIMIAESCCADAAKSLLVQRGGYGPGEVDKKWRFYRREEEEGDVA